ncbi:hypothetical protein [Acidovorax delafieldii]|nr:hypothetical protein [Acidovorax delafieldii]
MATKPQAIGPFPLGMDTRVPDFSLTLGQGAGHLLRDALNVDVTEQGTIKTRPGYTLAQTGTDCHSMWAPVGGAYALYCDDGVICRLDVSGDGAVTRTTIEPGYGSATPVRYAQVNEAVYFTDGLRVGSYHPSIGPTPIWAAAMLTTVGDQQLSPMPAGQHIAYHFGRLLVAVGSALIYSEPFTPHLRDEAKGFELFPEAITCLVAVEAGVFVVAGNTFFIAGGFPAQTVRAVLDYGAPDQQAGNRPDGGAHWMSERGIVSVSKDGEIANLQEKRVALDASGAASTLYRRAGGMETIVAALSDPSSTSAGVGSYAQARIVKKGT